MLIIIFSLKNIPIDAKVIVRIINSNLLTVRAHSHNSAKVF